MTVDGVQGSAGKPPAEIRLSELELEALARLGAEASQRGDQAVMWSGASKEEIQQAEQRKAEDERTASEAAEKLRQELGLRLFGAFEAGAAAATDMDARRSYNARSIALYLVVLSVVLMPLIAMISNVDPKSFGTYIAPVTGIAGTVVGYWFGTVERRPDRQK